MKRFRWYRSDIDRDTLRRLKNGIVANDYSGDQKEGFRLDAARPESLTGDFVAEHTYVCSYDVFLTERRKVKGEHLAPPSYSWF